ncbi:TatD family hydrolase [bacterium]|nr:TatD family hydrolase [bacterium]
MQHKALDLSKAVLIDAHSHLDGYEGELDKAVDEISSHKIYTVSCSMDIPSYQRNLEIAKKSDRVLPIFGIHPWNARLYSDRLGELKPYIDESPMLGEIGLDFYYVKDKTLHQFQMEIFEYFLRAAKRQDKIINVHTKGAEREVRDILRKHNLKKVIIHWYSGPLDVFRQMVEAGYYFTVGVQVLQSQRVQKIAAELPEGLLLTETDNPGGWKWMRGEPGMPALILKVIEKVAAVRKTTPERIIEIVEMNFRRLVGGKVGI